MATVANQRKIEGEPFSLSSPYRGPSFFAVLLHFMAMGDGAPTKAAQQPISSLDTLSPSHNCFLSLSRPLFLFFCPISLSKIPSRLFCDQAPPVLPNGHAPGQPFQSLPKWWGQLPPMWEGCEPTTLICHSLASLDSQLGCQSIPLNFLFVMVPSIYDKSGRIIGTFFRAKW